MTDEQVGREPAATRTAARIRANGDGSVFHLPDRRLQWVAVVTVGWTTGGRPVRRSRYAATEDEARALLVQMVQGHLPTRRKPTVASSPRPRHRPSERAIPRALRFRVLQRDGFACVYCGRRPPDVPLELDHRLAFSRGGLTSFDNLVTACKDCNRGKKDLFLDA